METQIPIFDIDTHYAEHPDLWTSRAPEKYKDQVLHVRQKSNGFDAWFVGGKEVGMTGPSVIDHDMEKHLGAYTLPQYSQMSRASTYAPERMAYMDEAGVGTQLVYPNIIGFGGQALMTLTDDAELRLFHVRAYNDAILDLQKESGGRILPQAALPLWDMGASLTELERVRKMGLTGIVMSHSPGDFGQPTLAHPQWDRFFTVCQDLSLPINFHQASGSFEGDLSKWWGADKTVMYPDGSLNEPLVAYSGVQLMFGNGSDICNLIMTGVLEKFPRLKFISVESACGWVPFAIQCLEHQWKEMMSAKSRAKFKRTPKEMFLDQIFCSYWFEDRTCVDGFFKEFGPDNLMFETDFPHPTSLYPNDLVARKIAETLHHHDRDTQEKVLHRNAERVYGVKVHMPRAKH